MPRPEAQLINHLTAPLDLVTGPHQRKKLPPVLPAGVLPGEQSNMWFFTPGAIKAGERFVQDDTREWFRERDFCVPVQREYPDHPRWLIDGATSRRAQLANGAVTSEVHILIRLHNSLPEFPDWVGARMAIKATQADLSYKLTKMTRDTFIKHGSKAMEDFATRAPAQFIKFVAATFVPKKIEVQQTDGTGLEPEERTMLLKALADELKRRQDKAQDDATVNLIDYEPQHDVVEAIGQIGDALAEAAADGKYPTASKPDQNRAAKPNHNALSRIKQAVNIIDHVEAEKSIYFNDGTAPPSVFDWEN